MNEYTNIPTPNLAHAERIIRDLGARDERLGLIVRLSSSGGAVLSTKALRILADIFMARYPRGKGTTGNLDLRQLYAACYAVKLASSMSRGERMRLHRKSERALQLTKFQSKLLMEHPANGETRFATRPRFYNRVTTAFIALYELGFVNGYFDENGYPYISWLTDLGMRAREIAAAKELSDELAAKNLAAIEERAQYTEGDTGKNDGDDHFHSGINIGEHYNAIVVYRPNEADAIAMRDRLLRGLRSNA